MSTLQIQSPKRTASSRSGSVSTPLLLLVIVLASIATVLCYRVVHAKFDSELRIAVRKELSELFPRADVFVGRVVFERSGTIVVDDVKLATQVEGRRVPVFSAEQVVISGQLDIADFLQQTPKVEKLHLIGVQVDAWPLAERGWSVECLRPQPKHNRPPPAVSVERSSLRIRQSSDTSSPEIVLHDIQAALRATDLADAGQGPAKERASAVAAETDGQGIPIHRIQATASARSSGLLGRLNLQSEFDSNLAHFDVRGDLDGLNFSRKLFEVLPSELAAQLSQLAGLECEASCSAFQISRTGGQPTEFSCQGQIHSGRLQDPRLPYPLERISSNFFCKNSLLQIRDMQAYSGQATLAFNADIMGLRLDSPMVIEAQIQNLDLDRRLQQSLPPTFQQQWDRLQLAGKVSGDLKLSFDGQRWDQQCIINCQEVSARPWLFPYPFTDIEGRVEYSNGVLSSQNLSGQAGGQTVEANMHLTGIDSQWIGRFQCKSSGAVVIDEELISALTVAGQEKSRAEQFVRTLNSAGSIELVNATFERTDPQAKIWDRTIDAHIYDGRMLYDRFPYPIYNIRGRIFNQNQDWRLESFEGRNDSARILCSGSWNQVLQGKMPFRMEFDAYTVPMAEDLYQALPQGVKNIWSQLQPAGSIRRIATVIERTNPEMDVATKVTIVEESDPIVSAGKSLRLYPHHFPFHLNGVNCNVTFENGVVTIHRASAQNGATRLSTSGVCRARPDGLWQADMQWLPTTRLMIDGQFVRALPKAIQEPLQRLDFRGPLSVLGNSQIILGDPNQKPPVQWNCQFDIEDGQVGGGEQVGEIRGTIWAEGSSDANQMRSKGSMTLDALRVFKNIPVTNLVGPFALEGDRFYFGSAIQHAASLDPAAPPKEVTASTLGGTLRFSGYATLDNGKLYADAALENAAYSILLKELGIQQQDQQTEGVCNAYLQDFRGVPWNPQTFQGHGSIHLTDARLYELPFMMRLFSVASVNADNASAFQRANIDFRIDGDHIPLKLTADGDVLRLRGEGWTNLRRDIDLELYAYVGRMLPIGQVASPLLAESRFATFMMVEVSGTLDNPLMQRRPFPQIEATFQQIFPELSDRRPVRDWVNELKR